MLKITVPATEFYDEVNQEFISSKEQTIQLEHSLISLSKWESKWKKPFLSKDSKSFEESVDYIKCMTITQNVPDATYGALNSYHIEAVNRYIEDSMTATVFSDPKKKVTGREIITAEIIYYWMIAMNIPFECQKWHLNRLLTLINVCSIKNQPQKKMSKRELMARNRALNESRKRSLNTKG